MEGAEAFSPIVDRGPALRDIIPNRVDAEPVHEQARLDLLATVATMQEGRTQPSGSPDVTFFTGPNEGVATGLNSTPMQEVGDEVEMENDADDASDDDIPQNMSCPYAERIPPSVEDVKSASEHLSRILKPPRNTGRGYKDAHLDNYTRTRLESMHAMMHLYTNPKSATFEHWTAASIQASTSIGKGVAHARNLCTWSRSFIRSHEDIPINPFGLWHTSLLDDEDLAMELQLHLQSIGKYVRAQDICDYLRSPEALARWGLEKTISPATAKRWMKRLGWRWVKNF
jgi:hypothetical protein